MGTRRVRGATLRARAMKPNTALAPLDRTLGTWTVIGRHPMLPGRELRGRVTFERVEDGAFVRMHSKMDDAELPEGVALFGTDGDAKTCSLLYFDSRGVSRIYAVELHDDGFTWTRDDPAFAQRFRVTIAADGRSMESVGTMKRDGGEWEPDLSLTYRRE